jgi:hypothetical protein
LQSAVAAVRLVGFMHSWVLSWTLGKIEVRFCAAAAGADARREIISTRWFLAEESTRLNERAATEKERY